MENKSYFDGGLLSYIGWIILGSLITSCTFGICYPWALCMIYGWKINHTVVEGRRLRFNGSAVGLFGNWIKWLLLIIVTLGIYGFWVHIKLEQWRVKNTTFLNYFINARLIVSVFFCWFYTKLHLILNPIRKYKLY